MDSKILIAGLAVGLWYLSQGEARVADAILPGGSMPSEMPMGGYVGEEAPVTPSITYNIPAFPTVPAIQAPPGFFGGSKKMEGIVREEDVVQIPTPEERDRYLQEKNRSTPEFRAKKREAQARAYQREVQMSTKEKPVFTTIQATQPYFPSVLLTPKAKGITKKENGMSTKEKPIFMLEGRVVQLPTPERRVVPKKEVVSKKLSCAASWAREQAVKSQQQKAKPVMYHQPKVEKITLKSGKTRTIKRKSIHAGKKSKRVGGVIRRHASHF